MKESLQGVQTVAIALREATIRSYYERMFPPIEGTSR